MSQWYFGIQKEKKGPVSEEQIRSLITSGVLTGDSPVWTKGMTTWVRLDTTDFAGSLVRPVAVGKEYSRDAKHENVSVNIEGIPKKLKINQNIEVGVQPSNGMAIAALILAIMGFFTLITAIPAVICGHIAMSQYKEDPGIGGRGMAQGALIMGYLVIGFVCLLALGPIIFFSFLFAH